MLEKIKQDWKSLVTFILNIVFISIYLYAFLKYRGMVNNYEDLSLYTAPPFIILIFPLIGMIFYNIAKTSPASIVKKINYFLEPFFITLMFGYFAPYLWKGIFFWVIPLVGLILMIHHMQNGLSNNKEKYLEYIENTSIDEDKIDVIDIEPGDFPLGEIYKLNRDETGKVPEGEDPYVPSGKTAVLPIHDRFVHCLVLGVTGSGKTSQTLLPMVATDMASNSFTYEKVEVVQMGQIVIEPKGDFAKTFWAFGKIKEREMRTGYKRFLLRSKKLLNEKIQELKNERNEWIAIKSGSPLDKADEKEFQKLTAKLEDTKNYYKLSDDEQIDIESRYEELREKRHGRELTIEEQGNLKLIEDGLKKLLYIRKHLDEYITLDAKSLSDIETYALFQYAANMSYIIANPALSDTAWKDITEIDPNQKRDVVLLFDPMSKNSPYFNPLYGPEDVAVGTVTSTILAGNDSSTFFQNIGKTLLQNAIHVVKRVYGNDATLAHVNDLLTNNGGRGEAILKELGSLDVSAARANENRDYRSYFQNDYYSAMKGQKNGTKTYEQTSDVRNRINNLLDNKRLRRVLCPPPGIGTEIDFDKILRTGDKVALSTQTGVSDELGAMLGSFLMLQLQDAISRRKGKENTRNPVITYIDEFQDYANEKFEDVLTKGRSYVVSMVMATQTLGIVEQKAGTGLLKNLQSNARNIIIYPGGSNDDVEGFRQLFGQTDEITEKRTISREVAKELSPLDKARMELGLSDKPPAERESIGEEIKQVERFTKEELMYGPNVTKRNINSNTAFGFIFYRLIVKNSIQVPAVAKIEYIPRELKVASDKLIQSYESVLEKELRDEENEDLQDAQPTSTVDALGGATEVVYQETTFSELNAGITKESDPSMLARDLNGNETDLSETKTETNKDSVLNLPEIEIDEVNLGEIPNDVFKIEQPDDLPEELDMNIELPTMADFEI